MVCEPDNCGGAGKGCEQECKGAAQIGAACKACDATMAAGACKTEFDACMADL